MSRSVRSLENLNNTASTSRVLNLRSTALRMGNDSDYLSQPLFRNAALNRSIILKHRLRQNEHDLFDGIRHSATKILLPIEADELRLGARYAFVGQRNYADLMYATLGIDVTSADPDAKILSILDKTPSLDPFLLREQLRFQGIDAAACYFEISEADMSRMFSFAEVEIQQLVEMSIGNVKGSAAAARTLARKILVNATDRELEPLRLTMQLNHQEYQEGIFCWKAFLYYKWRLQSILPELNEVMGQIEAAQPRGQVGGDAKAYIRSAKENIRAAVVASCRKVNETLAVYDGAYQGMTRQGDPLRFRDFLLQAPNLFNELGERLGGVDHIISFWRYRFPRGRKQLASVDELINIFTDFEQSLSFAPKTGDHDYRMAS